MMALEFAIWGCWLPLIYNYLPSLGFSTGQQAWILNTFPFAAIVGMFFSNQFSDRHFSAERFLAFSHLVGGLALMGLALIKQPEAGAPAPFWPFFTLMLIYCLLYVPTNSIANSVAFANIEDPQKNFGLVRLGGNIGWVLAAWPLTFILVDWAKVHAANPSGLIEWLKLVLSSGLTGEAFQRGTRSTFMVGGIVSLVLAAYSLTLPHTPPKKIRHGADRFAWLEALKLLKQPFVLVLWMVTFVDAFVLYSYFNWTASFLEHGVGLPGNLIMPVMSLGQISEMLAMLVLGITLKKLGWRWTMVIGILGHAARFSVYAFWPEIAPVVIVQLLHGICYAFFFAAVYIFADEYFPKDVRASAQGVFNFMVLGLGALAANWICPLLRDRVFTHGQTVDFQHMFLVPLGAAVLAALALALFFRPPPKPVVKAVAESALA